MICVSTDASDDLGFVEIVERVLNREVNAQSVELAHIVKIDSWFGRNWYAFKNKEMGAFGVHNVQTLRVPPFHPHRVVSERRFRVADPTVPIALAEPLHVFRCSESNRNNLVRRIAPSITVGWFSGMTVGSGRGSVMLYSTTTQGAAGWYVGLEREQHWKMKELVGIGHRQWTKMFQPDVIAERSAI